MGATAAIAIPMLVSGGASLYGAHSQSQANQANFNAAQQNAQYMRGLVGQNMQQGQNPYAQAMMSLMGGMRPPGQGGAPVYFGNYGMSQPQAVPQSSMPVAPVPSGGGGVNPFLGPTGGVGSPTAGIMPFNGPLVNDMMPLGGPAGTPFAGGPQMPGAGAPGYTPPFRPVGGAQMPLGFNANLVPAGLGASLLPSGGGVGTPVSPGGGAGIPAGRGARFLGEITNPVPGATQPLPGSMGTQITPGASMYSYESQGPGLVDFQNILNGSNFNTGQDALMQMMRRQLAPSSNPQMDLQLQQQGSGQAMFNNTPLFGALQQQFDFNNDQQIAGLRARAGSLGQLAGTGFGNAEANLRAQLTNNQNVMLGQLGSASYESAQQRAMQALGLQSQNLQNLNQFTLGAAGQQLGAAQTYGQQALGGLQAGLGSAQFNAGQYQQQNQFNAAQGNTYNQLLMQMLGGANSMQMGQQGLNAQLIGILNGVGVPAQQQSPWPGAVSDVSQLAMLYPFLRQLQGGGGGAGQNAMQNIANIPYNVLQGIGRTG